MISTNVPREGRARRTLFEADLIRCKDTVNALGHVPAGKRCATDIVNAFVESEPRARSLCRRTAFANQDCEFLRRNFPGNSEFQFA